jgi:hypothetical protein
MRKAWVNGAYGSDESHSTHLVQGRGIIQGYRLGLATEHDQDGTAGVEGSENRPAYIFE